MKLDLPDVDNLTIALDCESSGLHVDDGARLSIASVAWRDPATQRLEKRAFQFDQGPSTWLGNKQLPRQYELKGQSLFDKWDNLELDEWWQLMAWLQRQGLVFHNAPYDLHQFRAGLRGKPETGVNLRGNYLWDTMVVCPAIWPNERIALKMVAERLWGEGEKDLQKQLLLWLANNFPADDKRYDLAPEELILPYASMDADQTLRLYEYQQEVIRCGEIDREDAYRQVDLALVLYCMEAVGIGFDVDRARRAETTLLMRELEQQRTVDRLTGHLASNIETMRKFWFEQLALPFTKETDTGKAQVTLDVIRDLVRDDVPAAKAWQDLALTRKALNNWYSKWTHLAGNDNRLRCKFHQTKTPGDFRNGTGKEKGTISARLAVERVNLLAIPHDRTMPPGVPTIRQLFQAKPGHVLYEVDVSQAEMRAVAGLANCSSLLERFAAGDDAHNATCRIVFQMDTSHPEWDFYRQIAKRINFAISYGAGVKKLVADIEVHTGIQYTDAQVKIWYDAAKKSLHEIFSYGRGLSRFADKHRYIELIGGKRRYYRTGEFTYAALNAKVQGSVAVAMIDAMIDVHAKYGPDLMLLQIHDSLVIEPPIDGADEIVDDVGHIIASTCEQAFGLQFRTDKKQWLKAA